MSSYLTVRWTSLAKGSLAKGFLAKGFLAGAVAATLVAGMVWAGPDEKSPQLSTYKSASGEVYFALSVNPSGSAPVHPAHDVVVLVDTSASQTGVYRDDALAAAKQLMAGLDARDRVEIMAVDLDAVTMMSGFAPPDSSQVSRGLQQIKERAPLGSTDMLRVIGLAADRFLAESKRPRRVVYIGDGMSRANFLETQEFMQLIRRLVDHRISVSSYAIGPGQDVALLAVLANHTGGNLFLDGRDVSAQQAGSALASYVRGAVAWPLTGNQPTAIHELYPLRFPPLRWDRDTVVTGTMDDVEALEIAFQANAEGQVLEFSWTAPARDRADDYAFLTRLVELGRRDGGLFLPILGSAGLEQAKRTVASDSQQLSRLGQQAFASGDKDAARTLTTAALAHDPSNQQAEMVRTGLRNAVRDEPRVAQLGGDEFILAPGTQPEFIEGEVISGDYGGAEFGGVVPEARSELESPDGEFIDDVLARRKAQESFLKVTVRNGLVDGRKVMSTDPAAAVADLKMLLENIRKTPDISAEVRSQLISQIESGLREGMRREIEKEHRDALAAENRARGEEQYQLAKKAERESEKIKQLVDRFNALMDEGRYELASEAAVEAHREAPDLPITDQAVSMSGFASNHARLSRIRELKQVNFLSTLALVEEAHIPFPDEPSIIYPEKEFWQDITIRRDKWKAADLAEPGTAEERILSELKVLTEIDFLEMPLSEAIEYLEEVHDIQIEFDTAALDELAIDTSVTVTRQLEGITLKSALRLFLNDLELTYVIRDEVLMITSQERAAEEAITKVYPVADLVLPIMSGGMGGGMMGGGMGGGMGGMMGGGMGGMGGGMGGMGGGMGGMGGGFGGGGGFFSVEDDFRAFAVEDSLRLGVADSNRNSDVEGDTTSRDQATFFSKLAEQPSAPQPITLNLDEDGSTREAWDLFFSEQVRLPESRRVAPGDVRETVRRLMRKEKLAEIQDLILAAVSHGFPQPWMYEALGIVMRALEAPTSEIERALMSAVDFSHNVDEVYYIAIYMSRIGLEERALQLFREVAIANPTRPEPFAHALTIAQRLNDDPAIRWACLGVLGQAWPQDYVELQQRASRAARAALARLREAGQEQAASEFEAALEEAKVRDCLVKINWTGDADVDLLVEEPAGTICSMRNARTTSGGVMLGDASAASGSDSTEGISETYVCSKGFSGQYRLLIRPVWGEVTAGKVTVEVTTHDGSDKARTIRKQIPVGDKDVAVVFDLRGGRLNEPLRDHQVAQSAHRQLEVNRLVLAQQINQNNSNAFQDLVNARRLAAAVGRGPLIVGGVGYRPEITQLPEGITFMAQAVISADRRYVRITPSPMFSGITDVFTFNFVSGDGEQTEGGGGGGAFGGGGGGMGGGMGGMGGGF